MIMRRYGCRGDGFRMAVVSCWGCAHVSGRGWRAVEAQHRADVERSRSAAQRKHDRKARQSADPRHHTPIVSGSGAQACNHTHEANGIVTLDVTSTTAPRVAGGGGHRLVYSECTRASAELPWWSSSRSTLPRLDLCHATAELDRLEERERFPGTRRRQGDAPRVRTSRRTTEAAPADATGRSV